MALTPEQTHVIREQLAECLAVEIDEIAPSANFFRDLGGESIDLLDLSFRIEKTLGVRPDFTLLKDQLSIETDEQGELTAASFARVRATLPGASSLPRAGFTAQDLFSVEILEALIARVLSDTKTSPA